MKANVSAGLVGFVLAALLHLPTGCGLIDSGVVWRQGAYALIWIDDPKHVSLTLDARNGGRIGRISPQVFAVGANERFIVAKQHPDGDKAITNYFIIDITQDSVSKPAILGPLTEADYALKSSDMTLPTFTKVLESLQ